MVLSAVAALSGVGAITAAATSSSDDETVVLDVDDAIADIPPSTVAPLVEPDTTEPPTASDGDDLPVTSPDDASVAPPAADTAESGELAEPNGDDELSPLADLLGPRYSAVPEEIEPRPRPVGLEIDSIDVSRYPVRAVGLEESGELEVPDETEIGWYRYGATAGRPGATVLAAHVSWNDTTGPFFRLGTVEPGDRIQVALDNGDVRDYEVTERTMYDKDELPRDRIWRNTGPETLVLITCGGDFNPEIRRYRQNIVVYAVPVA